MARIAKWVAGIVVVLLGAVAGFLFWQGQAEGDPAFFEREIAAFEAEDRAAPPAPGGIVFVGSSSIRLWSTLTEDFAPLATIQRGFGGAHMEHVVHNARRIVTPYEPRAVVVFCGGNDIGSGKDAARVEADYRAFLDIIHSDVPDADVWLLSMKPSKLRWDRWDEMVRVNTALRALADADPRRRFVDVASALLGPDGTPRDDVYIFDGLHLNATGYAEWTRVIRPLLVEAYGAEPG